MKSRLLFTAAFLAISHVTSVFGGEGRTTSESIDLVTAMRLAGAQNLDVQIAQQRIEEAEARLDSATLQFLPWLSVGAGYKGHGDRTQTVEGDIIDADKQNLNAGGTLTAQVDLGDAIYKRLVEQQKRNAAAHGARVAGNQAVRDAVVAWFDLSKAQAVKEAIRESVRVSEAYEKQLQNAVGIGVAYKGDELRVRVQSERYRMASREADEAQAVAAAGLAQALHLDPAIPLRAARGAHAPISVITWDTSLRSLIAEAQAARPEVEQMAAYVAAAQKEREAAKFAPLVPSMYAQGFFGTFGGGRDNDLSRFGRSSDVTVGIGWRIGPGGLFDRTRTRQAEAHENISKLEQSKLADRLAVEVATLHARVLSLRDRLAMARDNMKTAGESLTAGQERKEAGVGVVLEVVQSQQDLTEARLAYVETIAEYNKAQYELLHALGRLTPGRPSPHVPK